MPARWIAARWDRLAMARRAHEVGAPLWMVAELLEVPTNLLFRGRRLRRILDDEAPPPFTDVEQEPWSDLEIWRWIRAHYAANQGPNDATPMLSSARPNGVPPSGVVPTTPSAPAVQSITEPAPSAMSTAPTATPTTSAPTVPSDLDQLPVHVPELPWLRDSVARGKYLKRLGAYEVLMPTVMDMSRLDPGITMTILEAAGITWSFDLLTITKAIVVMCALGFHPGSGLRDSFYLAFGGVISHDGRPQFYGPAGSSGPRSPLPPSLDQTTVRKLGMSMRNRMERLGTRAPQDDEEAAVLDLLHAVGLTPRMKRWPISPLRWHEPEMRAKVRETLDAIGPEQPDGPASAFWWHRANRAAVEQVLDNIEHHRTP